MLAAARATGETPPELVMPPMPAGCQVLWDTFLQFNNSRGGGMGPAAISSQEILAWQTLTGVTLNPWELGVIQALDRVALASFAEQQAAPDKPKEGPTCQ